jgi:hypothetical protein
MLKRMEECYTYLNHVFRKHHSGENPVKRSNIRWSFQPMLWLSSALAASRADESYSVGLKLYLIFYLFTGFSPLW